MAITPSSDDRKRRVPRPNLRGSPVRRVRPLRRRDARRRRRRRGHRRAVAPRGRGVLLVNGVDVTAYVEAELNRRFPGRAERQAGDPDGLRAAWAALERTWAATLERVAAMPPGTVDVSVDGEWSFAQTLRHLVMATDVWLGRAVLEHRTALPPARSAEREYEADGYDMSVFSHRHTVVRRRARGPRRPGRDGARLPRRRHRRRAGRAAQEPARPPTTRRPSSPACT